MQTNHVFVSGIRWAVYTFVSVKTIAIGFSIENKLACTISQHVFWILYLHFSHRSQCASVERKFVCGHLWHHSYAQAKNSPWAIDKLQRCWKDEIRVTLGWLWESDRNGILGMYEHIAYSTSG